MTNRRQKRIFGLLDDIHFAGLRCLGGPYSTVNCTSVHRRSRCDHIVRLPGCHKIHGVSTSTEAVTSWVSATIASNKSIMRNTFFDICGPVFRSRAAIGSVNLGRGIGKNIQGASHRYGMRVFELYPALDLAVVASVRLHLDGGMTVVAEAHSRVAGASRSNSRSTRRRWTTWRRPAGPSCRQHHDASRF